MGIRPYIDEKDPIVRLTRAERAIRQLQRKAQLPNDGGGIDFNKTNQYDIEGNDAVYLFNEYIGDGPGVTQLDRQWILLELNTGIDGWMGWVHDGDGAITFENNGDGAKVDYNAGDDYGGDLTATGQLQLGYRVANNGAGDVVIDNNGGVTVVRNAGGWGLVLHSSGQDVNGVSVKTTIAGGHYLIQNGETITRDPTSHDITAMTPDNALLKITNNGDGTWSYHIKTGASWVADL